MPPRATVRLQLHKDFNFSDAQKQVPYLAQLGISHLYLSPIHTARPGSNHGYDVIDYSRVNPELGGEEGFRELVASLRQHNMGVIVDIVPNHMAVGGNGNLIWMDILEWGRHSRYAQFLDIDWEVPDPALHQRMLAPFLGKPYGEALQDGEISLQLDADNGRIYAAYYDHHFPIAPKDYARILRTEGVPLADDFARVTGAQARGEQQFEEARAALRDYLADPQKKTVIEKCLANFSPDSDSSRNRLHRLLERQHYRLAWWRTAADEINWRRFFDVIELAGTRVQDMLAFEVIHARTFRLYQEGLIDGVRIDHIDGISDPRTYCRRLRRALTRLNRLRPAAAPKGVPYIYVEKILAPEEELSKEWQVDGDTGYSFMNDIGAVLHHPDGEQPLAASWKQMTGRTADFEVEEKRARRRTLQTMLAADFNACAYALHRIARSRPETRDYTLAAIRRVLTEILVEFPVYRTYVDARGRSAADAAIMRNTLNAAREKVQIADRPLMDVIDAWLGGEPPLDVKPASARRARLKAIGRFQQLSSPVAAKSVEDTAFYRYGPMLSRNEVGSTPLQFASLPKAFHSECRLRRRRYPHALLATATHDHKRGEDVRARLAVLSEIPDAWLEVVEHWREHNKPLKRLPQSNDGEAAPAVGPDAADEYMLYQMLVGAWPLQCDSQADIDDYRERVAQWQEKAVREAKRNSNWTEPNQQYEADCRTFLDRLLAPGSKFIEQLQKFVDSIAPAGAINSLSQTLVKMAAPGVPDFYQGCELWDFSFVDPDNRRPVDFVARREALSANADLDSLMADWRSGYIKQRLIHRVLSYRRDHEDIFSYGRYIPLECRGNLRDQVLAFARELDERVVVVVVPRGPSRLARAGAPSFEPQAWGDTRLVLPRRWYKNTWHNPILECDLEVGRARGGLPIGPLLTPVPVAMLAG